MNRSQKVGIPAVLFIVNALLAAVLLVNKDFGTWNFLWLVLAVQAVFALVLAMMGLRRDAPEASEALQRTELERDTLIKQRDAFQTAMQDAERDRQRLNSQQGLAQAELEQARVELARTKSALRTHDETLTSVRRQLEEATGGQQNAEINLQSRTAELEQLRQWRARAETELSTLQQQAQEETTQRARLEQERIGAADRMRTLETRLSVLEQELINRSSMLQAVLDSVADVVVIVSPDFRPLMANGAATSLLGLDPADTNLAQALPKFGLYLTDRTTQAQWEQLPFVNALRGVPGEPIDLIVRNSRRPAGVLVRAVARAIGDAANRSVVFVLQEARASTGAPPPVPAPAPPAAPVPAPVAAPNNGASLLRAEEPPAPRPVLAPPTSRLPTPPPTLPVLIATEAGGALSLRILLVEDSAVNQKLGVRVIEQTGHKATVAGSGLDALAALERETFDLVLMDLTMPGMGGIETTALIREQEGEGKSRVPIVAVTASSKEGSRERCLQWGMDGYIVKPLQPSKLDEVVQTLFKSADPNKVA